MVSSISWQKKELSNSSHACNWGSNCGFPGSFPSLLVFHETLCECGICVFCSSPCVWKPHSKAGFSGWKADAKMECLPQQVVLGQSHSRKRHSKNLNAIHHCSFLYSILYVSQSITPSESQNAMFFCLPSRSPASKKQSSDCGDPRWWPRFQTSPAAPGG